MNPDGNRIKRRKKLVVVFSRGNWLVPIQDMVQDEHNHCPQLVHTHLSDWLRRPSRIDRFLINLKVKKDPDSQADEAVAEAYAFIHKNYRQGDDVILISFKLYYYPQVLQGIFLLASYLDAGTRPQDSSAAQSRRIGAVGGRRIPIHCVAVIAKDLHQGMSSWTDELKSKLPARVEHIIGYGYYTRLSASCSTRFDAHGTPLETEICLSEEGYLLEVLKQATKHAIHYKPDRIAKWDQDGPVWTRMLSGPPTGASDMPFLETEEPVGLYRYELRKYRGVEGDRDNPPRLVWKATREQSAIHYYTPSPSYSA